MKLETAGDFSLQVGVSDFKTLLTRAKQAKADSFVFNFVDQPALLAFLKQARSIAPEIRMYGLHDLDGYSADPSFSKSLEGVEWVVPAGPSADFQERYRVRFNSMPSLTAGNAYDATKILLQALVDGSSTDLIEARLREGLFLTVSFGTARFDSWGGVDAGTFTIRKG